MINEEVLKRAIAYANTLLDLHEDIPEDQDGLTERECACEALEAEKNELENWDWGIAVRAYYDGVQSVYTEFDSAITNLSNSTIPPAPSKEFEL
jgi:hypothetical protein